MSDSPIDYVGTVLRAKRDENSPWGVLSGTTRYGQRTLIEPQQGGSYLIIEWQNHSWETNVLSSEDEEVMRLPEVRMALHLIATGYQHVPAVKAGVHAMYTKLSWMRNQFIPNENWQTANS